MIRILLLLLTVMFINSGFAETSQNIYSAITPIENQSEQARQQAFPLALQNVVDQLTTTGIIIPNEDLDELYSHANLYVASFSYVANKDSVPDQDEEQAKPLMMNIQFDRDALTQFFMRHHMIHLYYFTLQVSGISDEQNLNAMMNYLNQVNNVQSVMITAVSQNNVAVSLTSLSDKSRWLQTIASGQRLQLLNEDAKDASLFYVMWKN